MSIRGFLCIFALIASPSGALLQRGPDDSGRGVAEQQAERSLVKAGSTQVPATAADSSGHVVDGISTALSNLKEDVQNMTWRIWLLTALASWAVWVLLGALVALCCYKHELSGQDKTIYGSPQEILRQGHWNCFAHVETCCCAFLCPHVRWADNMAMAGIMGFWPAFALFVVVTLFGWLLLGRYLTVFSLCFGLLTTFVMLYFRQYLRKRLGMSFCTCGTCCLDCCYLLFCPFCAISQEARAVSQAYNGGNLVGSAVKTGRESYGGFAQSAFFPPGSSASVSQHYEARSNGTAPPQASPAAAGASYMPDPFLRPSPAGATGYAQGSFLPPPPLTGADGYAPPPPGSMPRSMPAVQQGAYASYPADVRPLGSSSSMGRDLRR